MPENSTEVTAAGIARLAGVGRAAVSNWRRRHADFPKPVGGTETSPSFALSDVEDGAVEVIDELVHNSSGHDRHSTRTCGNALLPVGRAKSRLQYPAHAVNSAHTA